MLCSLGDWVWDFPDAAGEVPGPRETAMATHSSAGGAQQTSVPSHPHQVSSKMKGKGLGFGGGTESDGRYHF